MRKFVASFVVPDGAFPTTAMANEVRRTIADFYLAYQYGPENTFGTSATNLFVKRATDVSTSLSTSTTIEV